MSIYSPLQEPTRNENVTITTSSTKISDARNSVNPRIEMTLRNISSNSSDIITISLGNQPAINNNGIVLRQYEGVTITSNDYSPAWQGTINAISTTGTASNLSVWER